MVRVLDRWPTAGLAVAVVRPGKPTWFYRHGVSHVTTGAPAHHGLLHRLADQDLHRGGRHALWSRAGRPRRSRERLPHRLPYASGTTGSAAGDPAPLAHAHRGSGLLAPTIRPAEPGLWVRVSRPVTRSPWVSTTAAACRRRSNPAPSGSTATTASPRSGRSWRTSRDSVCATTCASTSSTPGMEHTDLVRSERVRPGLANGYLVRSRGLVRAPDREIPTPGGGGLYSTAADVARYVGCLLDGDPVDMTGSCNRRPSRRCSPRTTSRTRACPGWVSASTSAPRTGTAPSGRPAWCRASSPPRRWRRVRGSGSWPCPTPAASAVRSPT